jgi:hypothetical protein
LVLTASAQTEPTGIVKGSVSGGGGPVVGARVVIGSGSNSHYTAVATTDKEGAFTFSDAPLGEVEVKVYDAQENLLVTGNGQLKVAGETITLVLRVP